MRSRFGVFGRRLRAGKSGSGLVRFIDPRLRTEALDLSRKMTPDDGRAGSATGAAA